MAKVTVTVCDVCKEPGRATEKWRIARDGSSRTFDLCEKHGAPLAQVYETKAGTRGQYRTFDATVATMEEIEAKKRKGA